MKVYSLESKNIRKERLNLIRQHINHEEKSKETKRINNIIQDLRQKGGVHGPTFWEVRRRILGGKKDHPVAIEDRNGKLLEAEILERYADYYEDLLSSHTALT